MVCTRRFFIRMRDNRIDTPEGKIIPGNEKLQESERITERRDNLPFGKNIFIYMEREEGRFLWSKTSHGVAVQNIASNNIFRFFLVQRFPFFLNSILVYLY